MSRTLYIMGSDIKLNVMLGKACLTMAKTI